MSTDAESGQVSEENKERKSWKSFVWDSLDKSPEERRLVLKLDLTLLTLGCLGYFTKYLDQANLTNAFVSGMKEDLHMFGNQLNYATTCFTVGYIVAEIPSNLILTRVRPSIFIPTCQMLWTGLTMCTAACKTPTQLYVLRFFVGVAEAGYYPGMNYMIGSWYGKDEMAKRACILNGSGSAALMFSGFLMTAVINLGGKGGLPGWKWLFIMDGVISFPIAVVSYIFLPDSPETCRGFLFTKEQITLAKKRMVLAERRLKQPITWAKVKKIFSSWHIYLLSLYYIMISGTSGTPIFPQYLKDHVKPKYSVQQINLYPTGTYAVQIFSALVFAWVSDAFLNGQRWGVLLFGAVFNLITMGSLAAWNIAEGWRWACYYLAGIHVGASGIVFTWANEICTDDTEERALVLATMNSMVSVVGAWLPLLVWQQVDAPVYHKGFITATVFGAIAVILIPVMKILQDKEVKDERLGFLTKGEDIAGLMKSLDTILHLHTFLSVFPWLMPMVHFIHGILSKNKEVYHQKFGNEKIKLKRQETADADETGPVCMVKKFIDAQRRKDDNKGITDWDISLNAGANIGAGSDTTAITLSSIVYFIYQNPQVLEKVRDEIETARLAPIPTFQSVQQLPYLQAVIKEVTRVNPASGLPLWREVPKGGAVLCGQYFPEGNAGSKLSTAANLSEKIVISRLGLDLELA
ncbi:uncharacterized protein BHQ10_002045 [Talaromyces amestolkiae]|uniref:Major facilitator superfamily (MFS) profile domain-containing protein n=1 Tax=Talaromyces amestolkiae TaxID=1196081 RepID=A0A364KR62_TALAM|nr:uncharacterized protein BHQ10_002045 [Talaromyces amestolkiae]RAO66033.1 hypothetical protein BHQ10_002045 [Talaromyces amestolkiae]